MGAKARWHREAWWVITHHKGQRIRQRLGASPTDRLAAEGRAAEINLDIANGRFDLAKLREQVRSARSPASGSRQSLRFEDYVRAWHRKYTPTFKHSYEKTAEGLIRLHLLPYFGSTALNEFTEDLLLAFIAAKLDEELSTSTIRNALTIVRRVLNLAEQEGLILRHPAKRIGQLLRKVDARQATEIRTVDTWTRDEVTALLKVAQEHEERFYPALALALATGMRRGEILGLKWADIDFGSARIAVRRALVRGVESTPKSRKSRTIASPPGLMALLLDVLADRRRQTLHGSREVPEWVFPAETGGPLEERNFQRSWYRVRRRATGEKHGGVRPLRFHCTRHTYASLALEAGKSVRWVADQLGHGNPEITLRTYTHALPTQEQDLSFADFGELGRPPRGTAARDQAHSALQSEGAQARKAAEGQGISLERETGLEPATLSLGS